MAKLGGFTENRCPKCNGKMVGETDRVMGYIETCFTCGYITGPDYGTAPRRVERRHVSYNGIRLD